MRMKKIQEGLGELADMAERDHEVQMARADLYKIAKYAIKLHEMLRTVSEAEGIEGWQQSKITKAADYMSSVFHSLDYDMKFGKGGQMPAEMPAEQKNYVESLQSKLSEKAVSQNQQQAAGIALKHKKAGTKPPKGSASASMMNMSTAELEKFAGTKHKGLPDKVDEESKGLYANVHAKRKRGEKPNPKGHPDRPTKKDWDNAAKTAKNESIEGVCSDCGNPSYTTLPEEKQKGVDGKVCWKGYKRMGTKKKGGKTVDNCVKM